MTISLWRYSHLLLALISSVFIIIASFTGAIIAFEPISEKLNPYKIKGVEQVYLKETVAALKQNYDEVIDLKTDYNEFVSATVITKDGIFLSGYIHPLTGAYLGPEIQKTSLFKFATNLHRSLFLKKTGRIIIGVTSFLLLIISITGILLIIRRQGSFKNVFSKIVYENFFQYFHVFIGRFSFIPILIITLTGVFLSLFRFDLFPPDKELVQLVEFETSDKIKLEEFVIFNNTKLLDVTSLTFPFSESVEDNFTLLLKDRKLLINQFSGEILEDKEIALSQLFKTLSINLHTGKGSIIWSLILAIASINILFFIYSGFSMTLKRKANKLKNKYKADNSKYVILVGSENGNTLAYANTVYNFLIVKGETVYITELNNYSVFRNCEHIIIFTSTYGKGEAPMNGNNFIKLLKSVKQSQEINYSVVGFGSVNYPDFCKFAIDITKTIKQLNLKPFIQPLYINNKSNTVFIEWCRLWSDKARVAFSVSEYDILENHRNI